MKEIPAGTKCHLPDDKPYDWHYCPFYSSYELDESCSWFDAILSWKGAEGKCPACLAAYPNGGIIEIKAKP